MNKKTDEWSAGQVLFSALLLTGLAIAFAYYLAMPTPKILTAIEQAIYPIYLIFIILYIFIGIAASFKLAKEAEEKVSFSDRLIFILFGPPWLFGEVIGKKRKKKKR